MTTHETSTHQSSINEEGSTDRMFGFVITTALCVIGFFPLIKSHPIRLIPLLIAPIFFLPAILKPSLLKPLNKLWTLFGLLLQRVTNPIIMGVLFFGVVTPIGFLMRIMNKDPLNLKFDEQRNSYWISKEKDPNRSMKHQY